MQLGFHNVNNQSSYTYDAGAVDKSERTASGQQKAEGAVNASTGVTGEVNPNTVRALEAANIVVNDATIQMVESMMKEGLRIDKESLQNMYRLLLRNPDVSSEQLVKMNALEMDVTPENIRQFQVYENLSHQLTDSFESLADSVLKAGSDLFEKGQIHQAFQVVKSGLMFAEGSKVQQNMLNGMENLTNVNKELLDMVDSLKGSDHTILYAGKEGAVTKLLTRISDSLEALKMLVSDMDAEGTDAQPGQNVSTDSKGQNGSVLTNTIQSNVAQNLQMQPVNPEVAGMPLTDAETGTQSAGTDSVNVQPTDAEQVNAQEAEAESVNTRSAGEFKTPVLPGDEAGQIENHISNQIKSQIKNEAENLQGIAKNIISHIQQGNEIPEMSELAAKIEKFIKDSLFGSREFAKELRQTMSEGLLLKPEDVADAKNMNEYFDKLMSKMEQMTNVLKDAGLNQTQLNQNVTSMRENVQFINQLNQVFQYVQIPLKMSQKNTSGDLYVYSNKKKLTDHDGNISAFVHLDMDHIGPLDVYIRMSRGMKVATDFYLKDEETLDFIAEHIHLLNERLTAKGYVIDTSLSVKEDKKEKSVVEHMMDQKAMSVRTKLLSVNSFDTLA